VLWKRIAAFFVIKLYFADYLDLGITVFKLFGLYMD